MDKLFYTILIVFGSVIALMSQQCDCNNVIKKIAIKVENNLASYQHQIVEGNNTYKYKRHKDDVLQMAHKVNKAKECLSLVSIYLSIIRDEHLYMYFSNKYLPYKNSHDTLVIRKFYINDEIVKKKNSNKKVKDSILGNWYLEGTDFYINIIESKNVYRTYAATIVKDNETFWRVGNVKFEIIENTNGELSCIYWSQNRIPKYYPLKLENGVLYIGRKYKFLKSKSNVSSVSKLSKKMVEFQSLTSQTNYLKIQSFDLSYKNHIDSVISSNLNIIIGKQNLIIDLRDNGGGGFDAFQPLLPFVLDKKNTQEPYSASVWVSPDNFKYYNDTKYDYAETLEDSLSEFKYVEELKLFLGTFTPVVNNTIHTDTLYKNPINVVVLTNQNSASTAEGFVLISKSSQKVKHFGDYTAGAITYGDIQSFEFDDLNINIAMTTKKNKFIDNLDIESIGICPDVLLDKNNENEWLNIVLNQLEN